MSNKTVTIMNSYENELVDLLVEFKGYPESQTKKKLKRMHYLINCLGITGYPK